MSVKNPVTYGDWYWKQQIEAQEAFDETLEDNFAPLFASIIGDIPDIEEMPAGIKSFLHLLSEPKHAGFGAFAMGLGMDTVDGYIRTGTKPLMQRLARTYNKRSMETWLTSSQANTLFHRNKITEEQWDDILHSEGFESVLRTPLYQSEQAYPTIPEMVLYSRYTGDPDNIWGTVKEFYNIDPVDFPVWKFLGMQRLTTEQAQTLYKRNPDTAPEFYGEIARIGWQQFDHDNIRELAYSLPNPMLLVQGMLMQDAKDEMLIEMVSKADIHPDYAQRYLDGILTKPASIDIVNYELRQDNNLENLAPQLRKIGIHSAFTDVYKTLAYQIPPVADIITMAVREAFTPSIAAQFGQYEDFPQELADWGKKKGLTEEWTQRYWAAHWSLPSPQQGFEMLHRGVIGIPELNMLLRASDVMPFWRDKLTAIAYRPLTRVDVRRMYKQGVLQETEVYEAYLEHGYNEKNAERMTEFTIKQTLASLSKFTSSDIVRAFTKRMIDRGTAVSLLRDIDIRPEDANYIISTAEYKRQWAFIDEQIDGIRNLYKKRIYDENTARDKLSGLNLPADQINVLMQQWFYEKKEELDATWTTAQTIKFLKRELITQERAKRELFLNGFDKEHADMYIRDALWKPPKE